MNFVEVDYGSFVGAKDCYCCCKRALEHTDTHYINQNDIDKYCVEASIPVLALPKNNTEGVELLEAEDNHIDKSQFKIFSRLESNYLIKLIVCVTRLAMQMEDTYACIIKVNFNTIANDLLSLKTLEILNPMSLETLELHL